MNTYRLQSSSCVYAPGIVSWAQNGFAFERDRKNMVRVICETWKGVPPKAAKDLLSRKASFTVEGETVVFTA